MEKVILLQYSENELKSLICNCLKDEINKFFEQNKVHEDDDRLMNRKELSDLLQISFPTIWKYQRNGSLPYYRIGGRILFKKREILKAIEPIKRFASKRY